MLIINLSIVAFACILYALSYISPRTDAFLFFISGILFFFAGLSGVIGYSDIEVGSTVTTNTTSINGYDYVVVQSTPIYSHNIFFTWAIPSLEMFIGFYMLLVFWKELNINKSVLDQTH